MFRLGKQHRLLDPANGLKFHYFTSYLENMELVVTVNIILA